MPRHWYVVRTKPQCEYLAARALQQDGIELFFPCVQTPRLQAYHADVPLFPGYLFLRYNVEQQEWPSVSRLPGILGWVRFNGVVPSVPDEVITDLAHRVDVINSGGGLWTRFRPGEKVRVVSGAMESLAEVIEEPQSPQSRVRVLLEFMGRLVTAQVPWRSLQPVQQGLTVGENHRGLRRTRGRGRWVQGFGPRAVAGQPASSP